MPVINRPGGVAHEGGKLNALKIIIASPHKELISIKKPIIKTLFMFFIQTSILCAIQTGPKTSNRMEFF